MAELSPAAQEVLDAATERWLDVDDDIPAQVVAAALRAAALYSYCPVDRRILMTIADELESHQ